MKKWLRKCLYEAALRLAAAKPGVSGCHYRLIILKLDKLGDAILASGAVRLLIQEHGEKEVLLVVSDQAAPFFQSEFPGVRQQVLPAFCQSFYPDFLSFLRGYASKLQRVSADKLVCLRHVPSDYLHAIARLLNVSQCYASRWEKNWENRSLTYPGATLVSYPEEGGDTCLEIEAHRRLLEAVLGRPVRLDEILPVITSVTAHAGNTLLVCPAAGDPLREYPPEWLAESVSRFLSNRPVPLHLCLPPDRDIIPWLKAFADQAVTVEAVHQPASFQAAMSLVAQAGLILAPESAPAHAAITLDKPGVFLLGGGHLGMLAPWSKSARQNWLTHPVPCHGCRWTCSQPEAYCITRIPPVQISEALLKVSALSFPESEK
jgi:ADP-heptose:LPS heptosyltransferase